MSSPEAAPNPSRLYFVHQASAATTRSSLELLELPYPFSQVGLLSASDFVRLARDCRSRSARTPSVDEQILEELHRCGALVPLFRVDLEAGPDAKGMDVSGSLTAKNVLSTVINELFWAAKEGRVVDPAMASFKPWPKERQRTLWPSFGSGYVYSRHQILALDAAMPLLHELKARRNERWFTWHLDNNSLPDTRTREALASWRSLAITLSALDTYYWPQITHTVSHNFDDWRQVLRAHDPGRTLAWLGISLEQIEREISGLLATASFCDDTGDFYELIRRAKADAWKSLRGDAAVAMDYRLAADVLTRFAGQLNPGTDYAGVEHSPLSQQGLSARPESLDAALTNLHLSPFPALVVGVEGETEYRLVPRVLDLLGITFNRNRIVVVDYGGTGDLKLLARYAVEPVLGRDFGNCVALDRPLTRFLILADAENNYKDGAARRKQRRLLLESLTKNVPEDLRSDYYINTRRGRIVEIRIWGKLPFEFAHFKDSELADAMLSIAKAPYPRGRAHLISELKRQRRHQAPDVSKVYRAFPWPNSGLTKPTLADALWPVLETKINDAIQKGTAGPPVMQACVRAYEMAAVSEKVSIVLRRRRWRPRK